MYSFSFINNLYVIKVFHTHAQPLNKMKATNFRSKPIYSTGCSKSIEYSKSKRCLTRTVKNDSRQYFSDWVRFNFR